MNPLLTNPPLTDAYRQQLIATARRTERRIWFVMAGVIALGLLSLVVVGVAYSADRLVWAATIGVNVPGVLFAGALIALGRWQLQRDLATDAYTLYQGPVHLDPLTDKRGQIIGYKVHLGDMTHKVYKNWGDIFEEGRLYRVALAAHSGRLLEAKPLTPESADPPPPPADSAPHAAQTDPELGTVRGVFPARRGAILSEVIAMLIATVFFAVMVIASLLEGLYGYTPIMLIMLLVAANYLTGSVRRWWANWTITVYAGGVAWGQTRLTWVEMDALVPRDPHNRSQRDPAAILMVAGQRRLYIYANYHASTTCIERITEGLMGYWQPIMRQQLAAGATISEGPVALTATTISINGHPTAFEDIRMVVLSDFNCNLHTSQGVRTFSLRHPIRWRIAHYLQQEIHA